MGFMEKIWMDGMKRYEYSLYQILVREDCNRIIDLGCGDGFHLFHFKKVGYETFGIERNKKACETAKHYGFHVMSNNISEIRHSSESFDIVRMMGVLEHIHNPVQYLKEIHNILKKDGELIIATPDIRNPWIKIFGKKSILLTDRTHLYIFSHNNIFALLRKSGFNKSKIKKLSSRIGIESFVHLLGNNIFSKIIAYNPIILALFTIIDYIFYLTDLGSGAMIVHVRKD